jgi:uncharacterized protein (TIGR03437 family)
MRFFILFAILVATGYSADFTTYMGPPSQDPYLSTVGALATDQAGDTYVTGNNFVTKLDPAGNIVFTTAIGGSYGFAIAVDPSGNVWVGGSGGNIPLVNPLQSSSVGNGVGFLAKMAPDGTLLFSSYFGGLLGNSGVTGVATDRAGNLYVTGWTAASDFPTTPGLPASPVIGGNAPVYGLFAAKLDPTGQKILYSTTIAGTVCSSCFFAETVGSGIAVDGSGNALVAGVGPSNTANLPDVTTSGDGAFVFKINSAGNAVVYFNYLESTVGVFGSRPIAADASGNAFIVGLTPTAGTPSAVKLDPAGVTVWTASLGQQSTPTGFNTAISVDSSDNVWLTGGDGSVFTPSVPFVSELSADGSSVFYSEQLPFYWAGQDIGVDPSGVVHVVGTTGLVSTITEGQPLAPRALSIVNAASNQLSGVIAPGEIVSIYGLGLGPTTPLVATPQNGVFPTSLGGVQVMVNGAAIPLLYVSASQINAEIPSPLNGSQNGIAQVQVVYNSITLPDFRLLVVGSNFAVFENPGGSMTVINQDGTLNKIANPATVGSVVSIWATGFGATGSPIDGAVASGASSYCAGCQIMLGSGTHYLTETVQYGGSSPGLIDGLMQINFTISPQAYIQGGVWVYFAPPGSPEPYMPLGWVNVSP